MNPRRIPERIRGGHSTNQRADLGGCGWTTRTVATLPRPQQAEPASVQASTVSGLTRTSAGSQPLHAGDRHAQSTRSAAVRRSRGGASDSGPPPDAGARGSRGGGPRDRAADRSAKTSDTTTETTSRGYSTPSATLSHAPFTTFLVDTTPEVAGGILRGTRGKGSSPYLHHAGRLAT